MPGIRLAYACERELAPAVRPLGSDPLRHFDGLGFTNRVAVS